MTNTYVKLQALFLRDTFDHQCDVSLNLNKTRWVLIEATQFLLE